MKTNVSYKISGKAHLHIKTSFNVLRHYLAYQLSGYFGNWLALSADRIRDKARLPEKHADAVFAA